MSWIGPDTAPASVRIATVYRSLNSSEQRVAALLSEQPDAVVDSTAQQLATRAGVARSTVVRTCQSLGYAGYPQLRVALARELSTHEAPTVHEPPGEGGRVRSALADSAEALRTVGTTLADAELEELLDRVTAAGRVLVVGNGLSGPLAAETALRLTLSSRPAEHVADGLAQRVFASGLREGDVFLALSATGADPDTVAAARAAAAAGAFVLALTSFSGSPILEVAQLALIVPTPGTALRFPAEQNSRVAHAMVLETLVDAVAKRREQTPATSRG